MGIRPIAALVAVGLAACGGTSRAPSQADAIDRAVERWNTAVVSHDGRAACAQLSAELRARIERHLVGEGLTGGCRAWAGRWVSPRHPASQRGLRVSRLRTHGARATVRLTAPGVRAGAASLVREQGRWRIDDY